MEKEYHGQRSGCMKQCGLFRTVDDSAGVERGNTCGEWQISWCGRRGPTFKRGAEVGKKDEGDATKEGEENSRLACSTVWDAAERLLLYSSFNVYLWIKFLCFCFISTIDLLAILLCLMELFLVLV